MTVTIALASSTKQVAPGFTRMFEATSESGIIFRWFEGSKYSSGIESFFPKF